jgi:hypothetical protein
MPESQQEEKEIEGIKMKWKDINTAPKDGNA